MSEFIWTPSGTDITERWKKYGWVPPSELKAYQDKWAKYREIPLRSLDDVEEIKKPENVINYRVKK